MQPIYFPFTFVPDSAAQKLAACFRQTIVYQPLPDNIPGTMQPWVRKGILNIRVPAKDDNAKIERVAQEYLNWANSHQNGSAVRAAFISALNRAKFFSNQPLSSHIVAEIKGHDDRRNPPKEASAQLFNARIFLYLAQQYDGQRQSITADLLAFKDKEKELMQALKKETEGLVADFTRMHAEDLDDSMDYMPNGRLNAWAQMYLKDSTDSALFVTTNRTILEALIDRRSTIENVCRWESIPVGETMPREMTGWRDDLIAGLTRIAEMKSSVFEDGFTIPPEISSDDRCVSLEVYIVPNCNPRQFFGQSTGVDLTQDEKIKPHSRFRNTIIGLIEP